MPTIFSLEKQCTSGYFPFDKALPERIDVITCLIL